MAPDTEGSVVVQLMGILADLLPYLVGGGLTLAGVILPSVWTRKSQKQEYYRRKLEELFTAVTELTTKTDRVVEQAIFYMEDRGFELKESHDASNRSQMESAIAIANLTFPELCEVTEELVDTASNARKPLVELHALLHAGQLDTDKKEEFKRRFEHNRKELWLKYDASRKAITTHSAKFRP